MSRGGSYGGGQSSLGYLFSSEEQPSAPPPTRPVEPPYGIDTSSSEKPPASRKSRTTTDPSEKDKISNNYHRAEGPNLGNFVTDRPSTKVKSVPGGDSSLGYLFGDK
ncbi:Protein SPIRAL1-like [Parasponia andersonii]|uniref:Protein SPIRAL1-like n=1 Tax=Parasponia andersonii TaxID=3476 RepID=A0A2P5AH60_PARAD|nr:Protein SPIRAL1-like [Parasponia andersonii]